MSEALRKTGGKLLVLILIAGLTFAVAAVLSTVEASAANQHFKVTTTAGLNMRSSTSTSSSVLKKIPYNTTVKITDYKTANGYDWGKTTYGGKTGWLAMKYVKPCATVKDGIYVISPKCASGSGLDVSGKSSANGANVQIWSVTGGGGDNQRFRITYLNNGFYKITAVHSGKALDVAGGNSASKTNVQQYTWNGTYAQQWQIIDGGNGYYIFSNRISDKVLDVDNAASRNGTNVWVYYRNDTSAQLWKLKSSSSGSSSSSTSAWAVPVRNYDETNHQGLNKTSWGYYSSGSRNGRNYHTGIDLKVSGDSYSSRTSGKEKDKVYALSSGKVSATGYNSANGNYVIIQHSIKQGSKTKTVYSFYGHLYKVTVKKGASVNSNTSIGYIGWSGSSPGNGKHLHFAVADKLSSSGGYFGYTQKFSGDKVVTKSSSGTKVSNSYEGKSGYTTFYNPWYVIKNGKLPS